MATQVGSQFSDPDDPSVANQARAKADKDYGRHYRRGVAASKRFSSGSAYSSPLERADNRGEPDAWYDGYHDHSRG